MQSNRRTTGPARRVLLLLGAVVVLLAAANLWLGLVIDTRPPAFLVSDVGLGVAFAVPGLTAMRLRPGSATGVWMLVLGLIILVETPYGLVVPETTPYFRVIVAVGEPTLWLQYAIAGRLLLGYPHGDLPGRAARWLVAAAYAVALLGSAARLIARWRYGDDALDATTQVLMTVWILLGVLAAGLLLHRLRRARPICRRQTGVAVGTAAFAILVFVVAFATFVVSSNDNDEQTTAILYAVMSWAIVTAVPATYFAGLLRERLAVARVGDLVRTLEQVGPESVERELARTLGDPGLRVAFPTGDALVDVSGTRFDLPAGQSGTPLGDPPFAVLVHDPALADQGELLRAAADAARMALDNARLRAQVLAQLAETRASRQRLATAADLERRRLERDLHDGAQQRLLGIGCSLGVLHATLASPADRALVEDLEQQIRGTIAELRDICQGLRPAILTDQGLLPTLAWLSRRSPMRVRLDVRVTRRLDPITESTAYDVVRAALHQGRPEDEATVLVVRDAGVLAVEVRGLPVPSAAGRIDLADRVGAAGGRLLITPTGPGAGVRAELPWTS